uniref:Uncharacterized protein n=1 Tax=Arundo donax TaxID=35708 RepID=A0A0A9CFV5_ARUDO
MRLELLDVGGRAKPPLLVATIAEPYAAAEAGSREQQQQEQGQGAHHAASRLPASGDQCLRGERGVMATN